MKIESILLIVVSCMLCLGTSCQNSSDQPRQTSPSQKKEFRILTDDDVVNGAERLSEFLPACHGKSIACVVNQTSMIDQTHLVDALIAADISVKMIFAPEHGFRGDADAGELFEDGRDAKTGLPIKSLYGSSKKPSAKELNGIDIVIFDIQDVGARFYTYLSTMHYMMEACAENNIKFILLDRPNPNGFYVDGPVLNLAHKSFVGMHPIPVVHGMTFGELAMMIKDQGWADCKNLDMEIISCLGYSHESTYILPIKPSPNLPNHQSIMLYPSICFFEPTNYSVGRGTNAQFQLIGEPESTIGDFMFTPEPLPGAMKPKHEGVICRGEDLRTYDVSSFYVKRQLDLTFLLQLLSGDQISKITNTLFFDKLAGNNTLRSSLSEGISESDLRAFWSEDLEIFRNLRSKYLLYN